LKKTLMKALPFDVKYLKAVVRTMETCEFFKTDKQIRH
jgi:hypothetical protein